MSCQPVQITVPGSRNDYVYGGLMCDTTDWLFGPLFDSIDDAEEFCDWIYTVHNSDPRRHREHELIQLKAEWESKRKAVAT